ncbi:tyrosine recombinase XerS [Peribacillus loiseleuriae]|uniref:tyrosine recombinase XerS n=1 Tax=Peribacillus loiseleuriae TaxID=1679170 RepID=UPI003D054988
MPNSTYEQDRSIYEEKMLVLPDYVQRFIRFKKRKLAPSTLKAYVSDFIEFFEWIRIEKTKGSYDSISCIPLSALEIITTGDIVEDFLNHINDIHLLRLKNTNLKKKKIDDLKKASVNRKLSSLKSLFYWLSNIAEDENLHPLLNRNVMAKIELTKIKNDPVTKAKSLEGKILIGEEIDYFLKFVSSAYGELPLATLAIKKYHQNKERDLAIISLILSAGLRIAEVANLNISDLHLSKDQVFVIRKGEKEQFVAFSSYARKHIQVYLDIRPQRYNAPKDEQALFLTKQQQPYGVRMTKRGLQTMIEKYGVAFGKPLLSAHKLRHSMATRHYQRNLDIAGLKEQLGHESIETTMIYTHILSTDQKDKIEKAERNED